MKDVAVIISVFICLNLSAQKGKIYQDRWHDEGIEAGNIPVGDYSLMDKGKLYICLSNNNDILFIDIKTDDPSVQSRILKNGMTLWVDMDNKTSRKLGIQYPIRIS